jgi:hypothetical protein
MHRKDDEGLMGSRYLVGACAQLARAVASTLCAVGVLGLCAGAAHAVPAFAVQTGQPCQACHVGGFGPQLTPFGRNFKLGGYTMRTNSFNVPVSAMAVASFINTEKANSPPTPGFAPNNNFAVDQISMFLAGGLGSHLGAFVQTTYDGVRRAFHWDNTDIRATTTVQIKGADVVLGASLNNNPTVEDAWNTTPAWGYPYTGSALASAPSASPLMSAALAQTSLGLTAYAWINNEIYVEAGGYGSPGVTTLTHFGVDPTSPGSIKGVAPYVRLAVQRDVAGGTLEAGAFGMQTAIYPGLDRSLGLTDDYTDLGVDASYIKTLQSGDVVTVNGRYIHEGQDLNYTCATAVGSGVACPTSISLNDVRVDASYYWRNKIGATVQVFNTTASANPFVFGNVDGFRTNRPDSTGVTLQLDGTPFGAGTSPLGPRFNMRLGVQYTFYTEFNGAASNWDGAGAKASDNNSFRVFTWIAY